MTPKVVLLVVIDCLRADHVSAYGYPRATTPTLDALAARGTLWTKAHSTSSWTKPSVTSILTGSFPSEHGAFEGVKRDSDGRRATTDAISREQTTIAERFSDAGWRCAAFINNAQLGEFTGLQRGFQTYRANAGKADNMLELLDEWLRDDPATPTFVYMHFLEAHWPYKPRRRHMEMFGGNRDTNVFRDYSARDFGRLRREISHGRATMSESDLAQMIQMYDGSVRRLDGKLKLILRMLEDLGLRDESALFVTADHGEEFLDHGKIGHGQGLYQELTHVPLVAHVPGGAVGERLCEPVSLVDLCASMLRVAEVDPCCEADLFRGGGAVVSELRIRRRYWQTLRVGDWKLHRRMTFDLDSDLRRAPRELVKTVPYETEIEFYDLSNDPRELCDRSGDAVVNTKRDEMIGALDGWWSGSCTESQSALQEVEIDANVVDRLRALGYVD